jgi:hypothetical protein
MLETRTETQTLTVPTTATGNTIVEEYLTRVRTALSDVPASERERLMEHAQAEIELELELRGLPVEDAATILAWKGSPAAFAERLRASAPIPELTPEQQTDTKRLRACRCCRKEVSVEAMACPHCGAPYPGRQAWRGWGYEWKSPRKLLGMPVVHIAFGRDEHGKLRVAKGIVAIGQFAKGGIAIGQFALGAVFALGQFAVAPIAVGQFALGVLALGQFGIGLLAGVGMLATGVWAKGLAAWSLMK